MDQLKELKNKLIEAQKPKSNFRLSERTVVDIIHKILNRNKISLIHTITGREYVTHDKVFAEIESELNLNKGRISLFELHKQLDLQNSLIEEKVKTLMSRNNQINLIEGNLISNKYLEGVCDEINDMLNQNGSLQVSDIANRFDLSIEFFKGFLSKKIGSVIKAELHGTRLFTANYINSQISKIRPVLIAATFPVQIRFIAEEYKVDEFIIDDLTNKIINSGIVNGRLISGVFEPSIYQECQISFVKGSLSQNSYIEYSKLINIGIKDPKSFLKDVLKGENGLFLTDHYISSNMLIHFEGVFSENFHKKMSTDLSQIFPFELHEEDAFSIVNKPKIDQEKIILINQNIIPKAKIQVIVDNLNPMIKEEASKQYNIYITKKNEKEMKKQEEEKKRIEEEKNADKKGNKKKQEKDKKKKGKGKEEDEEEEKLDSYLKISEQVKIKFSELIRNMPLIKEDELNEKNSSLEIIFNNNIMPMISERFIKFTNDFINTKPTTTTANPQNSLNQIENQFHSLQLILKSVELMNKISSDQTYNNGLQVLIANICKKEATGFFVNILTYQLIHQKKTIDVNRLSDVEEREKIISELKDEELINIFQTLDNSIKNNNLSQFMSFLLKNTKNLAISVTPIDKKKEKSLIDRYYHEFKKVVEDKRANLENYSKKEYISFIIDVCLLSLIKTNFYINVDYDITIISAFNSLFSNANLISTDTNSVLLELFTFCSLSEETFLSKQNEIHEYTLKLLATL